jgi:hypothetical protein
MVGCGLTLKLLGTLGAPRGTKVFLLERTMISPNNVFIINFSVRNVKMSSIKYYTIIYACHLCECPKFANARNLRDHYEIYEGI